MRVRILSAYPLILDAVGKPIESGHVIELLDAAAESLIGSSMVEPAPDADVTAEATLVGWAVPEDAPDGEGSAEENKRPRKRNGAA